MKLKLFIVAALVSLLTTACETMNEESIGQVAGILLNQGGQGSAAKPTTSEVSYGLKESLTSGVLKAVTGLSKTNGFLGNQAIKIFFPPEALKVEKQLRSLGLGHLCDNFVTSLNRAAEKASSQATPIFVGAIKKMTFTDAMNILMGADGSATNYLVKSTSPEIKKLYNPVIASSLQKVNATKHWGDVTKAYNQIPFVKQVNPNLESYVTEKAMSALFAQVKVQESLIRKNPVARTSAMLKKVFGYADLKKR